MNSDTIQVKDDAMTTCVWIFCLCATFFSAPFFFQPLVSFILTLSLPFTVILFLFPPFSLSTYMLTKLPTELLHIVLGHLRFRDLETLLNIGGIAHVVRHCLVRRFRFQYQASSLLLLFEGMPSDTRKDQETRHSLANQLLELICQSVEKCARQDQRAKFTELLSSLEKWVVRRVLSGELPTGMELDYADLCLDIRYMYLHRPAVRVLHDAVSPNECQVTL